jgi:hypothetical protein
MKATSKKRKWHEWLVWLWVPAVFWSTFGMACLIAWGISAVFGVEINWSPMYIMASVFGGVSALSVAWMVGDTF